MGFKRSGKIASKGMRRHVSVFTLDRRKGDFDDDAGRNSGGGYVWRDVYKNVGVRNLTLDQVDNHKSKQKSRIFYV